jgi:DNA invertase Pin-like site-specific DNA recombinase
MTQLNAVLYLCSIPKDDAAIGSQRVICRKLARQLTATVNTEFIDNGAPGRAADRPGYQALLDYLARTPTDLVIMTHGYRLARKKSLYLELVLQIGKFGTTVITQDKHIYLFGGEDS